MNVNGVTSTTNAHKDYNNTQPAKASEKTTEAATTQNTNGVIYESGNDTTKAATSAKKTYTPNTELIAKLKADAEARTSQLKSIVEQLICKQGNAIGQADDMWKFLASGNFTVDAATKAQAQADIAEDGYWGVEQTSDRILDFAKALSGGDPEKADEMLAAFKKGFEQATETWGDKLPDISQRTYDAVISKFDAWKAESAQAETTTVN